MIDKDKLKRRFSRNAKSYDEYANVQKYMGDYLIKLTSNNLAINILEVGSGTGYVTKLLKHNFPNANITAVDIAEGMIEVAKENFKDDEIDFICGDIETLTFNKKFDLIISNATFQWFNNPSKTLSKLKSIMTNNSTLCFSTFGNNTFSELHDCYKKLQDNSNDYIKPGQRFMKASELKLLIKESVGFSDTNLILISETEYIEHFDTCHSFFKSIKKIGANNSQNANSMRDPSFIQKVITRYEKNYTFGNRVQATYHALFAKIDF